MDPSSWDFVTTALSSNEKPKAQLLSNQKQQQQQQQQQTIQHRLAAALLVNGVNNTNTATTTSPTFTDEEEDDVLTVVWRNRTVSRVPDSIRSFYSMTRHDRSGAMITDMLMAHAFVFQNGKYQPKQQQQQQPKQPRRRKQRQRRIYRGVCSPRQGHQQRRLEQQYQNDHRKMLQALGLLKTELQYGDATNPAPIPCHSIDTNVSWVLHRFTYYHYDQYNTGFSSEWIQYMRQQQERNKHYYWNKQRQQQELQQQQQQRPRIQRIIVYIRRGDVTPCHKSPHRYLPNSHYLHLIDQFTNRNMTTKAATATTTTISGNNMKASNNADTNSINGDDDDNIVFNITIYSQRESFEGWHDFEQRFHQHDHIQYYLALDTDPADIWRDIMGWNEDDDDENDASNQDHPYNLVSTSRTISSSSSPHSPSPQQQPYRKQQKLPLMVILSRSTFCFVPALFAKPNTMIIYTPEDFLPPLPHWYVVDKQLVRTAHKAIAKLRRQCPKAAAAANQHPTIKTTTTLTTTTTPNVTTIIT